MHIICVTKRVYCPVTGLNISTPVSNADKVDG